MKFISLIIFTYFYLSIENEINHIFNESKKSFNESLYFTTWATALYEIGRPEIDVELDFTNKTLRQIVHISASGNYIRLKLSNRIGKTNLEIKEVSIADSLSQGSGEIDLKTLKTLNFNGEKNIIISPGEEIYSDTIFYPLKTLSEISISIYLGKIPKNLTGHLKSRTFSFIEEGNKIYNQKISKINKFPHWYFISSIEVNSNPIKKTIVCFGDSITDGTGTTNDRQNRWPDLLSTKLNLNKNTYNFAVINKGIGGTSLTTEGIERYSYDVLEIKGISHIIMLYGVNDINALNLNSSDVIDTYKKVIKTAHNNNIFIYAGTIMPYGNYFLWTEQKEKYRKEVNFWIKNTKKEEGGFDGFFDFDEFVKDPKNPEKMLSKYDNGDGIHPSPEGYRRMVQAIENVDIFNEEANFDKDLNELQLIDKIGVKFNLGFNLEKNEEIIVNIKGHCNESFGFRVLTCNKEGIKTSEYYYSGKILKGKFQINNIELKVYDMSNCIIIKRPLSTINIDNITLEYIEVLTENNKKIFILPGDALYL